MAALEAHVGYFNLKLDGAQTPSEVMDAILEFTVENSLHLPDAGTLRIYDGEFKWLDTETFAVGKKVELFGGLDRNNLQPLFNGEVATVELDLAAHGVPTLLVRCYDRSHRLHRGRYARSFVQMTDSDIVKKVGGESGFDVDADSTPQVHEWVFQNNQTNWEFLQECAERNGFRLYVAGERALHFKKVGDGADSTISLKWGEDLRSFRPRVSASPQVSEVIVRGWDPKSKRAIVGKQTVAAGVPQTGGDANGGEVAARAFGAAKMLVTDRPVHSQSDADALARSICDDIGGEFVEADGLCFAKPELKAGMQIDIANIGQRFSGKYFVTSATHTFSPSDGYSTQFAVSGKRPSTLMEMIDPDGGGTRRRLGGNIVVGTVTDNKDPDDLGRVKVMYPWLTEEHTSFWARTVAPMAGPERGFYFLPEIDDEVLVALEHGDIRRPYIVGALWNGKDKPVEGNSVAVADGKVNRRTIKTRIGHTVLLDDTDGKGEVSITTANDHRLALDDKNQNITVRSKSGHKVILDDARKLILIEDSTGNNRATIHADDNSIVMECMGDFSIKAQGKVAIEGQTGIEMTTPMQLKAEGSAGVQVKTDAMMELEAQAEMSIKSSGDLAIQGTLVRIN